VSHGLNVDAGVFVSYVGLFSYYNYDNWTYQPSLVLVHLRTIALSRLQTRVRSLSSVTRNGLK
jgi:hypothetical protein